jgi:hypothetical protein
MAEILRWCGVTASYYREKSPKRKARPIHARFQTILAVKHRQTVGPSPIHNPHRLELS